MHRLRRALPSLGALAAFEAAARQESFTRAAQEMGVTQAAVSRRIRELEQELGQTLFERAHRRVRLTDAGRKLSEVVSRSFDDLADTVDMLKASGTMLTVAVSVAYGHFRLLPALTQFRAVEPEIDLRVISEDVWNAPNDTQIDVAIRYGKPPFRGMQIATSMDEAIVPVCAPPMAERIGGGRLSGFDLVRRPGLTFIESAAPEPSWMDWAAWLRQSGSPPVSVGSRLRFSSYLDAAYAAIDGQGIALGWTRLLDRALNDGRLVALDVPRLIPKERHFVLVPDHSSVSPQAKAFIEWIARSESVS